jgi:cytidylate kinase
VSKRQIITIAGRAGSGKSSTAKSVAAQLDFRHFSSGDLFRELGKERGHDVLQTNLSAEQNAEVDYLVDARLRAIGEREDRVVIDSRLAWHWIPTSFKVFLDLDLGVAAERILKSIDPTRLGTEEIPGTAAEYTQVLANRIASESRRYKMLYNVDPYEMSNYDLVIDTALNSLEQVVYQVVSGFKIWIG